MNALRFTFRLLLKNPGFAAVVVLTLALLFVGRAFADLARRSNLSDRSMRRPGKVRTRASHERS